MEKSCAGEFLSRGLRYCTATTQALILAKCRVGRSLIVQVLDPRCERLSDSLGTADSSCTVQRLESYNRIEDRRIEKATENYSVRLIQGKANATVRERHND